MNFATWSIRNPVPTLMLFGLLAFAGSAGPGPAAPPETQPAMVEVDAIRCAMDEAIKCRETVEAKNILFGLTGTGYFDMSAYSSYLDHTMTDYVPKDSEIAAR